MKKRARGCIDLGSSFFRLLVVEDGEGWGSSSPRILADERAWVGLGEDLVASGTISPSRLAAAERALRDLVKAAGDVGCADPVIVGTNTFRAASNGSEAAALLGRRTALAVTILSQRGEAALGFIGATAGLPPGCAVILVDPGGTSTEIAWGEPGRFLGFRGLPWGTHRVDAALVRCRSSSLRLRRETFQGSGRAIALEAGEAAREAQSALPGRIDCPTIVATGGTAVSLAAWKCSLDGSRPMLHGMKELGSNDLLLMRRRLRGRFEANLERRIPLEAERIPLLPAGALIVDALVRGLGARRIVVTARDLRWGILARGGRIESDERE